MVDSALRASAALTILITFKLLEIGAILYILQTRKPARYQTLLQMLALGFILICGMCRNLFCSTQDFSNYSKREAKLYPPISFILFTFNKSRDEGLWNLGVWTLLLFYFSS